MKLVNMCHGSNARMLDSAYTEMGEPNEIGHDEATGHALP